MIKGNNWNLEEFLYPWPQRFCKHHMSERIKIYKKNEAKFTTFENGLETFAQYSA